ncbi:hypothetical protein [Bacteroides sp.]|uniref:hypothetical protein n=1 Tax=Bacteroides sp. TaxID=29523 RepID=UPI002A801290|nr:hypothetical protein [Bacteroides sp.]
MTRPKYSTTALWWRNFDDDGKQAVLATETGKVNPVSALPVSFYTFSFGCATPFCNNCSFAQGVPPLCGQVRFLPFSLLWLFRLFPFPGQTMTASRWVAPFLSILNRPYLFGDVPLSRN